MRRSCLLPRRLLQSGTARCAAPAASDQLPSSRLSFFALSPQRGVSTSSSPSDLGEEPKGATLYREGIGISEGLSWALAARGVVVKERAFHNLDPPELKRRGAIPVERLSGLPIHIKGNVEGGDVYAISSAQFSKLLKQVTSHISSVPSVFVQDGAIGSLAKCDAKVRIISDNATAMLSLSNLLWKTTSRAISHDTCPLTIYIAASISSKMENYVGLKSHSSSGFLAAHIERSSLILCGRAFADPVGMKHALAALTAPVITARRGIPLYGRILLLGDSAVLFFAHEETIQGCSDLHDILLSKDAGVVLSPHGIGPFFQSRDPVLPKSFLKPTSVVFVSVDSSGILPSIVKLSPGQAAYHFLAGYNDGNFFPTYCRGPLTIPAVELAKAMHKHVEENSIPSFLINVNDGGRNTEGKKLIQLVESTISNKNIPESSWQDDNPKVGDLKGKYRSYLSGKFRELPEEFSL